MQNTAEMEEALFRAWNKVHPRIERFGLEHISPADRAFAAIWFLEAEVNNGGFSQYMFNSTGDEAPVAREALAAMGATASLRVFDDFLAVLPEGRIGADRDARQLQLDECEARYGEEGFEDMLSALDHRFYATEDDLRERLFIFVTTKLAG